MATYPFKAVNGQTSVTGLFTGNTLVAGGVKIKNANGQTSLSGIFTPYALIAAKVTQQPFATLAPLPHLNAKGVTIPRARLVNGQTSIAGKYTTYYYAYIPNAFIWNSNIYNGDVQTVLMRAWDTVNNCYVFWKSATPSSKPTVTVPAMSNVDNLSRVAIVHPIV